jgi:hypothetical protein
MSGGTSSTLSLTPRGKRDELHGLMNCGKLLRGQVEKKECVCRLKGTTKQQIQDEYKPYDW